MPRSGRRGKRHQRGGTIKDRLGFQTGKRKTVKARLGVSAASIGQVLDARQKINLNRVQMGRIGDAREKIEAARRRAKPGPGNPIGGNKCKNCRCTDAVAGPQQQNKRARGRYYGRPPQEAQLSRHTDGRPRESAGKYRSVSMNMNDQPDPVPRNNSYGAPSHDDGGLSLARADSNASAVVNKYSYGHQKSPLKSGPSVMHRPQESSGSSQHSEAMDEDEPPPPRQMSLGLAPPANSESRYKVLISNLQPTVTSEDIVDLFEDFGEMVDARLTSPGHAEVCYTKKADALLAVETFHDRFLDGSRLSCVYSDCESKQNGSTLNGEGFGQGQK